ncbi:MAG: heme exporter protein CcmD [Sulfitobacter sp.]
MPDLGKYAIEVMSAYGASLLLLAVLLGLSLRRGRAARAELTQIETEAKQESGKNG